jgi:hypothetical protein
MNTVDQAREERDLPEKPLYLAMVAAPPAIFITHFVVVYALASIWCAKVAAAVDGRLVGAFWPFAAVTLVAIGGVAWIGWGGYRRHRHGDEEAPHDMDTPGDRHRFLGFATLLLAELSGVGILFVAAAFLAFDTCQ